MSANVAAMRDGVSSREMVGPHAWLLRRLARRLACGVLTLVLPNGAHLTLRTPAPGPEAILVLHRWRTLRRLLLDGDNGFAEAYLDRDWSSPDISKLLELAARNAAALGGLIDSAWPRLLLNRVLHSRRANTRDGSRRNIMQHYDLGNAFYALWLDSGMSYSSGLYETPSASLEDAQAAKQARVLELLKLTPGQSVLEIGFGWGGQAELIAAEGGRLTGLTLSPAQHGYAETRLNAAGLQADLRLQDYRDVTGSFDRIVSIEMLEAVGIEFWPVYFAALRRLLAPDGIGVLQAISIADDRFQHYRSNPDFIQRHIFPGGMLPCPSAIRQELASAGLVLHQVDSFGESYARTLHAWHEKFDAAWPQIAALGFQPRFRRLWKYYLGYCEAGFRAGIIDVGLWTFGHAGPGAPL